MGLLDEAKPTPRKPMMGLLADIAMAAKNYANKPSAAMPGGMSNPPLSLLSHALGLPAVATTLDRMSYGQPLTTAGQANVPFLRPETADAAMFAAPAAAKWPKQVAASAGLLGGADSIMLRAATVWHGSPHTFDKFSASKIGTGEGAQAYGHGLYLAESPNVAKAYKEQLSAGRGIGGDDTIARVMLAVGGDPEKAAAALEARAAYANMPGGKEELMGMAQRVRAGYDPSGSLYKVDLPDDKIARMLDWDKPLSQQHPDVQNTLNDAAKFLRGRTVTSEVGSGTLIRSNITGADLYNRLANNAGPMDAIGPNVFPMKTVNSAAGNVGVIPDNAIGQSAVSDELRRIRQRRW